MTRAEDNHRAKSSVKKYPGESNFSLSNSVPAAINRTIPSPECSECRGLHDLTRQLKAPTRNVISAIVIFCHPDPVILRSDKMRENVSRIVPVQIKDTVVTVQDPADRELCTQNQICSDLVGCEVAA